MISLLIAALVVMSASLIGVIAVWKHLGTIIERNLSILVSFSAGVFLFVSYELAHETFEHATTPLVALLWIALGAGVILVLFRVLPAFHHHHEEEVCHPHSTIDARRILTSDAIHNVGDGVVLAAAFSIGGPFGIAATASIFVHELVQEISEFFVLRQAGYSVRKALAANFLVSGTILIGALGAFFLFDLFEMLEVPLLGVAAGSLLAVVLHDLVPHSVRSSHATTKYIRHLAFFLIGLVLMAGLATALGHSHQEGSEYEEVHS